MGKEYQKAIHRKEKICMARKHIKRCFLHEIIWEMQVQILVICSFSPIRLVKKKSENTYFQECGGNRNSTLLTGM